MGLDFNFSSQAKNKNPNQAKALPGWGGEMPSLDPSTAGGSSGFNPYPSGSETLGQPMYPWLMPWQGPHAAPLSGYEGQALNDMSNFAGSGFGLGSAQDYLHQVLGGQWLDPNNKYFDQIQKSGSDLLKGQQYDTLKRIGSSAAAGGNGLSGARLAAEGRYLADSNQSFDQMMAQLRANQYAQERGYMNQAPGMLNNLSQTQISGLGQLMNMGAVPRNIQNQEIQGQYNDWLRQIGAMRDEYRYPDQLATAFLGTNKYPGYQDPKYGNSTADQLLPLLAMLLGGGGGSGNGLISFGNGGNAGAGNKGSGSLLSVGDNSGVLNQIVEWIVSLFGGGTNPTTGEQLSPEQWNDNSANPFWDNTDWSTWNGFSNGDANDQWINGGSDFIDWGNYP